MNQCSTNERLRSTPRFDQVFAEPFSIPTNQQIDPADSTADSTFHKQTNSVARTDQRKNRVGRRTFTSLEDGRQLWDPDTKQPRVGRNQRVSMSMCLIFNVFFFFPELEPLLLVLSMSILRCQRRGDDGRSGQRGWC